MRLRRDQVAYVGRDSDGWPINIQSDHQRPYAEWSLKRHLAEHHGGGA